MNQNQEVLTKEEKDELIKYIAFAGLIYLKDKTNCNRLVNNLLNITDLSNLECCPPKFDNNGLRTETIFNLFKSI